jgi:hypothetical protein
MTLRCASDRNIAKHTFTLRTVRMRREHRPGPSSDRPLVENPENQKVTSSVLAMQGELNKFKRNEVWNLVPRSKQNVVGTKWVFHNK